MSGRNSPAQFRRYLTAQARDIGAIVANHNAVRVIDLTGVRALSIKRLEARAERLEAQAAELRRTAARLGGAR